MFPEEVAVRKLQNRNNPDIIDIKGEFNRLTKYESTRKHIILFLSGLVF
jgi:hypothetical protein